MRPSRLLALYAPLLTLMLGHFTNDILGGVLTVVLPRAKDAFDISNAQVGLITLAYTGASSVSQPLFGYVCDRYPVRGFAPTALVWGGLFAAAWGLATSFEALLVLALLAGLGSGAYHPFGATNVAAVTPPERRNTALSVYTFGGSFGFGLGPIIGAVLLGLGGNHGLLVLAIPALVVSTLIWRQMGVVSAARAAILAASPARAAADRIDWWLLARVISLVMLKSWVVLSVFQFLPTWFDGLGYSPAFYATLTTVTILSGAIGTLCGGLAVNRIGPRRLLIGSLALLVIPLALLTRSPGPLAFLFAPMLSFLGDSGIAVPLAAAQRLLPGRAGVASGLILGLGFVTGGIGVPLTGLLSDHIGIPNALLTIAPLSLVASVIAARLPQSVFEHVPVLVPEAEPVARISAPAVE